MIKYHIGFDSISIASVVRETRQFVVLCCRGKERREAKDGYFDTFAEAKAEMVRRAERSVASARRTLYYAESKLNTIRNLTEPTTAAD